MATSPKLETKGPCDWTLSPCNFPMFHSAGAVNPMGKLSNCRQLLSESDQPNALKVAARKITLVDTALDTWIYQLRKSYYGSQHTDTQEGGDSKALFWTHWRRLQDYSVQGNWGRAWKIEETGGSVLGLWPAWWVSERFKGFQIWQVTQIKKLLGWANTNWWFLRKIACDLVPLRFFRALC